MKTQDLCLAGAICRASLTLIQAQNALSSLILSSHGDFAEDPFGNYVVQYVLGLQDPQAEPRAAERERELQGERGRQPFATGQLLDRDCHDGAPECRDLGSKSREGHPGASTCRQVLSRQKFSSNVVERCLQLASAEAAPCEKTCGVDSASDGSR